MARGCMLSKQWLVACCEGGLHLQAEEAAAFSAINAVGDLLADMPDELRCQHEAVWRSMAGDIESLGFSIFKLRMHDAASIRLLRRLLAAIVPATEGEARVSIALLMAAAGQDKCHCILLCEAQLQAWHWAIAHVHLHRQHPCLV